MTPSASPPPNDELAPLSRLVGLETEYAIRYAPADPAAPRPPNGLVYRAIVEAVAERVKTYLGAREFQDQVFLANGGAMYYEFVPHAPDGGLLEASTPECQGPLELLVHQRAQDRLLGEACDLARAKLARRGFDGEIGLLKNCRDAAGHTYGAQENYEVDVATGPGLVAYRLALTLFIPLAMTLPLLFAVVVLPLVLVAVLAHPIERLFDRWLAPTSRWRTILELRPSALVDRLRRIAVEGEIWASAPIVLAFAALCRLFAFRRVRHGALAFLVTRPIFTGAGSLERGEDGRPRLFLSEKGRAVGRLLRTSVDPECRPVFDIGNLYKQLWAPLVGLGLRPLLDLFQRRQRLQLGLSDTNMCETAEFLKIGATCLVIDLAERGRLDGLPRLARPIEALRAIVADPTLSVEVELVGGGTLSALEIQRRYLARIEAELPEARGEVREVLDRWRAALDALARDPGALFGRIDWVTKASLVGAAGGADFRVQKKIDLKYHELARGYYAELERDGLAPRLASPSAVVRAEASPPPGPASRRAHTLEGWAAQVFAVGWRQATVRDRGRLRTIRF